MMMSSNEILSSEGLHLFSYTQPHVKIRVNDELDCLPFLLHTSYSNHMYHVTKPNESMDEDSTVNCLNHGWMKILLFFIFKMECKENN